MSSPVQVLHVDDDPAFGELVADFLERKDAQINVTTETSATDGIEQLSAEGDIFDCIVSDYDMPGKNGLEFFNEVRDRYPDLPFILFTGKGSEEVASEAISAGATDYLQKGGGTEQYDLLANRVRNAVEQYRSTQERDRVYQALETATQGIGLIDNNGEYIYLNEAYTDLYGYDTEDLIGEHWSQLYPDGEITRFETEILPTLEKEGSWNGRSQGLCRDGSLVPEQVSLTQLDSGGHVCVVQDISTRVEREQELELRNRAIDEAPVGVTITDPNQEDNPIIYANEEFIDVSGYSREEIIGGNHRILQGPETREAPVEKMRGAIDTQESVAVELRNYRKNGDLFWNRVSIAPVYDSEGTLVNYIGFQEEITDRKVDERELERRERQFEAMFNDPNILVGLIDLDGTVLDINETAISYTDVTRSDVVDKPFWETPWFSGDPELQERIKQLIDQAANGEYAEFELDLSTAMETPLVVNGVFRPVTNEDGEVVSLLISDRDITEQKQREAELETVQRRFEAVLQNTTTPMFMKDDQGTYIFVNKAYCDLFGLRNEEIVGRTDTEIHSEAIAAVVQANDQAVLERGVPIEAEEQIVVGGKERTFLSSKVPIYDTGERSDPDTPVATFGVATDITDRKEAEHQLRGEQQFVQSIFQSLPDPFYAFDTNGNPIRWNEQIETVTGYSSAEIEEMHVTDFFSGDEAESIAAKFQTTLDEQQSVTVEATLETKGGARIPYEFTGGPLEATDGSVRGVTGIGRDITERHRHEQQLEELNRISQDLMRADTQDEIVEIGVETTRDLLGMKMSSIHLYDEDADALVPAAFTKATSDLIGEPPTFSGNDSIAWRIYQRGEPRAVDDVHEDADRYNPDTPIRSEILLPLGDHGILLAGSPSPATFDEQDVLLGGILAGGLATALEQVERTEQLRARERELTKQNARLEEFASIVSHDLRNPLGVASGYLELAAEECDSDHLAHIESAHERIQTLIEDLLSLAREGEAVTDVELVDLGPLVERCWANVETDEATLVTDVERTIQADKSRLKQVFENLMRNAVEHGGENVSITVDELDDGFYFEDDGSGIPAADRETIFEAGHSTSEDGTGFGLSIVKQIVEAHDWQIRAMGGINGGARFEITGVEFAAE